MNTRDGRFAGVSALTGFDSSADGRGMALVDWDNDGDLDVWITQRTAPRLRFLRNDNHSTSKSLRVQLNASNGNLHGIGTRVEVTDSKGHRQIRSLRAGEGYLGQSSQTLHFGLGTAQSISSIKVRWPDGQMNTFKPTDTSPLIRLTQNSSKVTSLDPDRNGLRVIHGAAPSLPSPKVKRVIPHSPLPLPPIPYFDLEGNAQQLKASGRRTLIILWATWCLPCLQELAQLSPHKESLAQNGLDILILNLDNMNKAPIERLVAVQRMQRRQKWTFNGGLATTSLMEIADAVRTSILGRQWTWSIPSSILLDENGRLVAFYEGSPDLDQLETDTRSLFREGHDRLHAVPYPGNWYVDPYPPDHLDLANILKDKQQYQALAGYFEALNFKDQGQRERASHISRDAGMEAAPVNPKIGERLLSEAIRFMPANTEHIYTKAIFSQSTQRFSEAIRLYEQILELEADHLRATAGLAWLLAVAPDAQDRNPAKAVRIAKKVCEQTQYKLAEPLDVLASAYAANGAFDQAILTAQKALDLSNDTQVSKEVIGKRLLLFQKNIPFRLPRGTNR